MERWPFMDWDFLLVLKFCKFLKCLLFRLNDFKKYNFKGLPKVPFLTKITNYSICTLESSACAILEKGENRPTQVNQ